jgi:hypothetical protein
MSPPAGVVVRQNQSACKRRRLAREAAQETKLPIGLPLRFSKKRLDRRLPSRAKELLRNAVRRNDSVLALGNGSPLGWRKSEIEARGRIG